VGNWWAGGEQCDLHAGGRQLVDVEPVLVHGDGDRLQSPVGQLNTGAAGSGVLHRDSRDPLRVQGLGKQGQGLRDSGDHDDIVRVSADAAVARQPAGQFHPQSPAAARVAVAEVGAAGLAQDGPLGAQPRGSGERGQVRHAWREVQVDLRRFPRQQRRGWTRGADSAQVRLRG